jgi:hypothetical protein
MVVAMTSRGEAVETGVCCESVVEFVVSVVDCDVCVGDSVVEVAGVGSTGFSLPEVCVVDVVSCCVSVVSCDAVVDEVVVDVELSVEVVGAVESVGV